MNLYPAIDILGGSAVRLVKGDFDSKTVYDEDPLSAAKVWVDGGARFLHVVDLDGAKSGRPVNLDHLRGIASLGVPVEYGGGLRSLEAIDQALGAGAERVILGTAAFTDERLLERALETHGPERVVVSVDVRAGEVSIEGWTKAAEVGVREVFATLIERGVQELAYTNVDRDGMLGGLSFEDLIWVAKAAEHGHLVYSGGIGDIEDLRHLAMLRQEAHLENLTGVIVGKALYEGRFTIAQAHAALAV
ncbi:MAG TPA: 1-(5-phosphoribosyl)-5-[(5-phosphoribosylamino)methylideneamino]imidazole-4-carboxamide isomerase [Solirubrobacteraceae bacterium]|jgi:phosphoribosylformimino-5-aminoimidazole carboxamide ribotide isomerase|nr:1-(5-phosphoribosyl)-5-[(5-phosphoribosylamino)methylideneamino]imidazole-4-carboxamide isomerase [Solirubrobacteraceae bacterium]